MSNLIRKYVKTVPICLLVATALVAGYLLRESLFGLASGSGSGVNNDVVAGDAILRGQVEGITSRIAELETAVGKLSNRGNEMRRMVDLPRMGIEVTDASTGGAAKEPEPEVVSGTTDQILRSAVTSLRHLRSEIKVQEQSYADIINKYDFDKGFFASLPSVKPMEGQYSSTDFGIRMHPVLGVFKTHEGLDIVNDIGTPVYATGDGVVEMAGQSGGGYGVVIAINHGYGYQTLYAHLSKVMVHDGQHVHRGELIAKSGNTGLVSGPHLHYEVRYKGVCKNPVDFFIDDTNIEGHRSRFVSR